MADGDPSTSTASANASAPFHITPREWTTFSCETFDKIAEVQSAAVWNSTNGTFFLSAYSTVCSFGAIANLLVLFVFARSSTLRNVRNSFIVNLAFSDLLLCLLTGPATLYLGVNLFWPFGTGSCKVLASVQALNTFVSSLTLALIALDRVLLTIAPFKWRMAARAPLICYAVLWLISLIIALPYATAVHAVPFDLFPPWNDTTFISALGACRRPHPLICRERNASSWDVVPISKLTYTLAVLAVQYLLPLFALGFAYIQIGSTIRRRGKTSTTVDETRRITMQQKNRKALVLLIILVATYALSWAPVNIYNVLSSFDIITFSQHTYLFCHIVGISSACINPITYALVNDSFRDAAGLLLWSRTRPMQPTPSATATKRTHVLKKEDGTVARKECIYVPAPSHTDSLL